MNVRFEFKELLCARPRKNPEIASKNDGNETVLVNGDTKEEMVRLNQMAARIWSLCDGKNSIDDMAGKITTRYNVSSARCRHDIICTLMNFRQKGLISA